MNQTPVPRMLVRTDLALDNVREHGTRATYRRGCRCLLCRVASAKTRADYREAKMRYADAPQEA